MYDGGILEVLRKCLMLPYDLEELMEFLNQCPVALFVDLNWNRVSARPFATGHQVDYFLDLIKGCHGIQCLVDWNLWDTVSGLVVDGGEAVECTVEVFSLSRGSCLCQ